MAANRVCADIVLGVMLVLGCAAGPPVAPAPPEPIVLGPVEQRVYDRLLAQFERTEQELPAEFDPHARAEIEHLLAEAAGTVVENGATPERIAEAEHNTDRLIRAAAENADLQQSGFFGEKFYTTGTRKVRELIEEICPVFPFC